MGLMLAMQGEKRGDGREGGLFHGLLLEQKAYVMACPSWDEGLVPSAPAPSALAPSAVASTAEAPLAVALK